MWCVVCVYVCVCVCVQGHFETVLEHSNPSVAQGDLAEFEEFTANYGQEGA